MFQVKLSPAVEKTLASTSAQKLRRENELQCICGDLAVFSSSISNLLVRLQDVLGRCTDGHHSTELGILL